jgi:nucleolar protein 53
VVTDRSPQKRRAMAELAAKKRHLAMLSTLKTTTKAVDARLSEREQARLRKKALLQAKLRQTGLVGRRLGKHIVQEAEADVQLGEDLSESLRGLKVR